MDNEKKNEKEKLETKEFTDTVNEIKVKLDKMTKEINNKRKELEDE